MFLPRSRAWNLSRAFCSKVCQENWEAVIGLEVHAQISSATKLFSRGTVPRFNSPVNSCVSLFDASIPGTLPLLNSRCVEAGISAALALDCSINLLSTFDRKHYFYADLPLGYQITQSRLPLASGGSLPFWVTPEGKEPYKTSAPIIQLQLENDSGKSLHDYVDSQSLIDLNRCGVGLMEIVFGPCLSSGEEAVCLVKELSSILTKIRASTCKMEEGALRVDANISVRRPGAALGTRTEVKNLNSTRSLLHAIEYEVKRQIQVLESGETVMNETLGFDSEARQTVSMRDKESKLDYRFMPEPNLLPLRLRDSSLAPEVEEDEQGFLDVHAYRLALPPLPEALRKDLIEIYGLNILTANFVVNEPLIYDLYSSSLDYGVDHVKTLISILTTSVQQVLKTGRDLEKDSCLTPKILASIANAKYHKTFSYQALDKSLAFYLNTKKHPIPSLEELIHTNDWETKVDETLIQRHVDKILRDNSKKVEKFLDGKKKAVMKSIVANARKDYQEHEHLEVIIERLHKKLKEMSK